MYIHVYFRVLNHIFPFVSNVFPVIKLKVIKCKKICKKKFIWCATVLNAQFPLILEVGKINVEKFL